MAAEPSPKPTTLLPALYLFLSRCFSYPTEALWQGMLAADVQPELECLVAAIPFSVAFHGLRPPALPRPEFESFYINMFDMAPICPLYESSYPRADMGGRDINEEVVRFYGHFGVKLAQREKDYHDHLATELEFMSFLAQRESEAIERGCEPRSYRLAQRDFLDRHLTRWVPLLCARLNERAGAEPFFREAGALLLALVSSHAEFVGRACPVSVAAGAPAPEAFREGGEA